jgi:small subunit ribosomal protein S9
MPRSSQKNWNYKLSLAFARLLEKNMAGQYFEGIGRRKTSTARVRLHVGGAGVFTVNEKPATVYFGREVDVFKLTAPLQIVGAEKRFDITVKVMGGGSTGQADAVAMGVARALLVSDPDLKAVLRKAGYLTRDARAKERKKPGLKRARKAPQYTKR